MLTAYYITMPLVPLTSKINIQVVKIAIKYHLHNVLFAGVVFIFKLVHRVLSKYKLTFSSMDK